MVFFLTSVAFEIFFGHDRRGARNIEKMVKIYTNCKKTKNFFRKNIGNDGGTVIYSSSVAYILSTLFIGNRCNAHRRTALSAMHCMFWNFDSKFCIYRPFPLTYKNRRRLECDIGLCVHVLPFDQPYNFNDTIQNKNY